MLAQFRVALPRNLVFAAAASSKPGSVSSPSRQASARRRRGGRRPGRVGRGRIRGSPPPSRARTTVRRATRRSRAGSSAAARRSRSPRRRGSSPCRLPGKATATSRPVGSNSTRSPRRPAPAGRFSSGSRIARSSRFRARARGADAVAGPARSGRSPPRAVRPGGGRSRRRRAGPRCAAGTAELFLAEKHPAVPQERGGEQARGPGQHRAVGRSSDGTPQAARAPVSRSSTTVPLAAVHHASRGRPRTRRARRARCRFPPRRRADHRGAGAPRGYRGTRGPARARRRERSAGRDPEAALEGRAPAPSVTVARLSVRGRQPAWLAKTSVPGAPRLRQLLDESDSSVESRSVGDAVPAARHRPPRRRAPRPRRGRAPRRPAALSRRRRRGHGRGVHGRVVERPGSPLLRRSVRSRLAVATGASTPCAAASSSARSRSSP